MAQTKVIMPQMGESVAEGTVAKWLKQPGDKIEKDENILEISTDKIDVEVPAPAAGYLIQILVEEGTTVAVGTPLAVIADTKDEKADVAAAILPKKEKREVKPPEPVKEPRPVKEEPKAPVKGEKPAEPVAAGDKRRFYTPVVLRMAAEHDIDLGVVEGSGMGGRVTKKDVLRFLEERGKRKEAAPAVASERMAMRIDGSEEIITMTNVRRRTAEHMARSKQTSAHVTSMQEVDMTNIARYRESVKGEFLKQNGFPLTYLAIITKEVVETIKEFPYVNASVDGDKIIIKHYINIGMAVALPDDTLIVPVIKNADDLNIRGLARAIYDLAHRARSRKLILDDIEGGTFTITNHGLFGSVFGTPIINQPQVAILGTGAIRKRPWVVGGDSLAIRDIMFLSLTYDHRIIDGSYGGRFSQRLTQRLESWDSSRM
jgi:2-oxoglutarate dehydrogenase dihydrolipoamide succinyltransferase (E2 component)